MTKTKKPISTLLKKYIMYIVLILLVVAFAIGTKGNFLNPQNLINIINQNVYRIIIGVGITFIMLGGAMDLSTGYQVSTLSVIMGLLAQQGMNTVVVIIAGIVAGMLLGMFNGMIYARLKVFPFIITLATQYILNGVSFQMSNSKTLKSFDTLFTFFGKYAFKIGSISIPIAIIIMIAIVAIGAFILNKTYFGRNIYALGANPDAVALSGVSVAKMRILIFAVAGIFVALGSIMNASKIGAVSSQSGVGAEFTVMAGAMLGGIKMGGGGGKINNMVVGVIIIGLLDNGMTLLNMSQNFKNIALGVILLLAITIDTLQTESAMKRAKLVAGQPPNSMDEGPETAEDISENEKTKVE